MVMMMLMMIMVMVVLMIERGKKEFEPSMCNKGCKHMIGLDFCDPICCTQRKVSSITYLHPHLLKTYRRIVAFYQMYV